MKSLFRYVLMWFLTSWFISSAVAETQREAVAQVVFVHGNVSIVREGVVIEPKAGDSIVVGDRLKTLNNAHIHLKTVDDGFISLRPESELLIERYDYDVGSPSESHIKLSLDHGVMRSVSGKGAQAAKEHYRLNTPVSAIGVRGTDYSVLATPNSSLITVQSGGVVMSPYNDQCVVNSDQQCQGETLFAHQGRAMLALSQLQTKPQLILNPPMQQTPDGVQQPLPQEGHKASDQNVSSKILDKRDHLDKQDKTDQQGDKIAVNTTNPSLPVFSSELLPPVKSIPPEEAGRKLHWGKWQAIANLPADEVIKQLSDLKLVGFNNVFMLKKDDGLFMLPSKGVANFTLTQSEAYIQKGTDYSTSLPAKVEGASLQVDFAHQTFATQLSVVGEQQTIPFTAKGEITDNGQLYVTHRQSNGGLMGSLSGYRADQASYIFQTNDIRDRAGYTAIGITNWQR